MRLLGALGLAVLVAGCGPVTAGGAQPPASTPNGATPGGDPPPATPPPSTPPAPPSPPGDPAPGDPAPAASRCTIGPTAHDIDCDHQSTTIAGREVLWQTPLGTPPTDGWPLVIIYQGSLLSPNGQSILAPHGMWKVVSTDANLDGIFSQNVITQLTTQTTVIKRLLDGGFAVVTPTADNAGFAWDTNLPPWLWVWEPAPDNDFLVQLFNAIDGGQLGPLSSTRWYATGVSSGGYMTSRMAVSYAGRFRALVIAAGSYATCGGDLPCSVPTLATGHPPTLFLQGQNDPFVPVAQMQVYYNALLKLGCDTQAIVVPNMTHGWAPQSPDAILGWFSNH